MVLRHIKKPGNGAEKTMQPQKSTSTRRRRQKPREFVQVPSEAFPVELQKHYAGFPIGINLEQGLDVGVDLVPDNDHTSRLCRSLKINHPYSLTVVLQHHSEIPYLQAKKLVEDGFGWRIMSPALYWCVRRWAREHDEELASSLRSGHEWLDAVVYKDQVVIHPDRRALKQKLADQDRIGLQPRTGQATIQTINPDLTDALRPIPGAARYSFPVKSESGLARCEGFEEKDIDICSGLPRRITHPYSKPLFLRNNAYLELVGGALRTVTDYRSTGLWYKPEEAMEGLQIDPIKKLPEGRYQTDPFIGVRVIKSGGQ